MLRTQSKICKNMNTLHFKYALEVERTGSITQAADNLYMGQPNLSKAIKELEDTLGITIFQRTSKGVVPTAKGEEFLKYAREALYQVECMEKLSLADAEGVCQIYLSIPRCEYIAHSVSAFLNDIDTSALIDMRVRESSSLSTADGVAEEDYGIGIIRISPEYENYFLDYLSAKKLSHETVWDGEYLLLMAEKHPLAAAEKITVPSLTEYTEVAYGDEAVPYAADGKTYNPLPGGGKRKIFVYDRAVRDSVLKTVKGAFMRVSPVPENILADSGLVIRRCESSVGHFRDVLVFRKNHKFSTLERQFIDKLYSTRNDAAFGMA